ncbi:MAG: hypothetical protein HY655_00725 [Acidobacteria bacterium]|nr:hypothetical protein [Acidobacteriota bacterium]
MTVLRSERGVALLTVLLLVMLAAAMLTGVTTLLVSDQRLRGLDRTRTQAFYGAHGALERLTADLGNLFTTDFAPAGAEILALTEEVPELEGVSIEGPDGASGYEIDFDTDADGNPVAENRTITSGPFQGLIGLVTPYTLSVVARTPDGSEVELRRALNTVSIPVFQFGIFSETDLSFFAGPNFSFGGRVHTNGNLFLASGSTLTMADRVTAVGEVVRTNLSNGWSTLSGYTGTVRVPTAPGVYRNLARTEGSLVGTLGSAQNEPTWTNLSIGTYNGYIRNGRTGASTLSLPFVTLGATPLDLIRRAVPGEDSLITSQRYYALASLRILLSDTSADLTGLPGAAAGAPIPLDNLDVTPIPGYTVDALHAPLALSSGVSADGYRSPADTPLHGGFIKIEMQRQNETWQDVTLEILNLGIAGRNLAFGVCPQPAPNAILRLQRVRDNPVGGTALPAPPGSSCGTGSVEATDYWPNVLYDPREGNLRDSVPRANPTMQLGGVMHHIELDVANLSRWFQGAIGVSGSAARDVNGFTVYFSDRRTNRNGANQETGEYGFEDFVNPGSASGTPNDALDTGEDVNGNGALETYGEVAIAPMGATGPLNDMAGPSTPVTADVARVNRAILFRRALKLTDGALGNLVMPGLTIASENAVYIQGNYNANDAGFGAGNAAASVAADAVTLLSNAWNDTRSLNAPNDPDGRAATTTWYRLAILGGKGPSFPRPTAGAPPQDFGTDGGVHNFLRYIESWNGQTLNFLGAIASFYFNRQAVGTYKCCQNVYEPPTRAYAFDLNFLDPALLPPMTPMFRDINTTGFTQVTR